jgi:UDP-GlcNAc:undecaprenyl-phosphate GlcNAc-1-phosphate transferase
MVLDRWDLAAALVALFVSLALAAAMARGRFLMDHPNARSSHVDPTPRGGGIGIVVGVIGASLTAWLLSTTPIEPILTVLAGATIVGVAGLADDIRAMRFLVKLAIQLVAALLCVASGPRVETILLPGLGSIELGWMGAVVAVLWLVGLTNAFNFMDGLDGLAGASAMVAGLALGALALLLGASAVGLAAGLVAMAAWGFLVVNRPPARVFMGDVGSQFLGFLFAGLGLVLASGDKTGLTVLIVPLLFFHFLFDTAITLARRWRAGERVTAAHRSHLYQRLQKSGWTHGAVSGLLAAMAAIQGALAYGLARAAEARGLWAFAAALAPQLAYAFFVTRREGRARGG